MIHFSRDLTPTFTGSFDPDRCSAPQPRVLSCSSMGTGLKGRPT